MYNDLWNLQLTNREMLPNLRIGDIVAKIPIIQGGMGVGISLSGLAAAVANEGAVGVISAAEIGFLEPDFNKNPKEANLRALAKELKKAKAATSGIIGVNIMVAMSDFDDLVKTSVENGADIIISGAGLPLNPAPKEILKNAKTKFVPIVSSARATNLIFRYWISHHDRLPDAVVIEGPLAGGHLGFKREQIDDENFQLEKILPEIISIVKSFEKKFNKSIPVIPAGGIYTGADIAKYLKMGASGVQMATRFAATYECDASDAFKEAFVRCKKEDITIIQSPVGMPGRAIRNSFIEDVEKGLKKPYKCVWQCLKPCDGKPLYCIASALYNAQKGFLKNGYVFAGANAWRVDRIMSVKELIKTLVSEYEAAVN